MKMSDVTAYNRFLIYGLTWKNLLQIVMCQCTLLICVYSVLPKTLFDSGTQLSILKEDLISHPDYEVLGEVKLQGFNGNISSGKIILLNAKLVGHNVYVPLRCVVCQSVSQDCLLSVADYRKLLQCQDVR